LFVFFFFFWGGFIHRNVVRAYNTKYVETERGALRKLITFPRKPAKTSKLVYETINPKFARVFINRRRW